MLRGLSSTDSRPEPKTYTLSASHDNERGEHGLEATSGCPNGRRRRLRASSRAVRSVPTSITYGDSDRAGESQPDGSRPLRALD